MVAFEQKRALRDNVERTRLPKGCYSVEFSLDKPRPLYQFKIWESESNPMFMVVKKNSSILAKLKPGSILNMTYYGKDNRRKMETRIGSIISEQQGRFNGHCTIDLLPMGLSCTVN